MQHQYIIYTSLFSPPDPLHPAHFPDDTRKRDCPISADRELLVGCTVLCGFGMVLVKE